MKFEKCIVSVLYFVVCFAKKKLAKCEKCIVSLTDDRQLKIRQLEWFMVTEMFNSI